MGSFKAERTNVVHEERIVAPVERVFPLCCPVEEYKWIAGWKCELLHCPKGRVEEGCIFSELFSAPFLQGSVRGKTTWTAVLHDPGTHRLHFLLSNEVSVCQYKIELAETGNDRTDMRLDLTYTARNKKGNRVIARNGNARISLMLALLAEMLKHYCETGEMLKTSPLGRRIMKSAELTAGDKVRVALNKLVVALSRDSRRQEFLATRPARTR